MRLYQVAGCPFAHRARIVLEEKKLRYEVIYFKPGERPDALVSVSPDAKSPTLFDDSRDIWIWDSLVVIEYLEERYPEVPLMPKAATARAHVRLMIKDVDTKLFRSMEPIVRELVHKPPSERNDAIVDEGVKQFHEALDLWQARLEHKAFLVEDTFSLADVVLFTPLFAISGILGERGEIHAALLDLRAWRDRVASRPSTAY